MTHRLGSSLMLVIVTSLALACTDTPRRQAVVGPAPDSFRVAFATNKGTFVVQVVRAWSPNGADRFHALAREGFFDEDNDLWAPDGTLLAQSRQVGVMVP